MGKKHRVVIELESCMYKNVLKIAKSNDQTVTAYIRELILSPVSEDDIRITASSMLKALRKNKNFWKEIRKSYYYAAGVYQKNFNADNNNIMINICKKYDISISVYKELNGDIEKIISSCSDRDKGYLDIPPYEAEM